MELLKSLQWRYATKKMNGEKIPQDKLDRILEATRLAPSSYGLTPYQIIVVENQELKEQLVPACYGQTQLADSSAVLVFATWDTITESSVDKYMNEIATQREISVDMLGDFSGMVKGTVNSLNEERNINEPQSPAFLQGAVMRRATGIMFKGNELLDGDIVAQHCQMVDDYTGKASIELNRLLISWNGKNWDVKCIDAMVGYRNNFWGHIPRFDELVGNAIDNSELLCGGAVWKPYA